MSLVTLSDFCTSRNSPETPQPCIAKLRQGDIQKPLDILKAKMLTDWDPFSVMNYCFDIYSHRVQLSDCDIAAYQSQYKKPSGNPYQSTCKVKLVEYGEGR